MEEHRITLTYSGGELERGIDPRTLSDAISGFADFVELAAREVFAEAAMPEARVAQVAKSSLAIEFLFVVQSGAALVAPIAGDFNTLVQFITNCVRLIKFLKGQPPKTKTSDMKGNVMVENVEGDVITVNINIANSVLNFGNSRNAERFVRRPLAKDAERLQVRADGKDAFSIEREDAVQFIALQASPDEKTITGQVWLTIVAPVFEGEGKWRLHDGLRHIYAEIEDADFVSIVKSGRESFARGDQLLVLLRTTHEAVAGKVTYEYYIEKVLEHVSREPPRVSRRLRLLRRRSHGTKPGKFLA